jgi:thiamine-monophosphate kinase
MMTIADLGEFGLIAALAARLPQGEGTLVGIGDDAAVLAVPGGRVVATTDLLVEGRHFRRDWSGPADIGGKAAAQNLADVAAMGASPIALLVGLAAPGNESLAWTQDLISGLAEECAGAGASVVGGDLSGADTVMIAVTALGHLAGRSPVTRSGARPGDVLALAGTLGHSAAGLALLAAGLTEPASLIAAHRRPRPPYQAGPEAAALGATAMIDVSDGLLADAGHVARASGVRIDIDTALLPRPEVLAEAASALPNPDTEGDFSAGEAPGPLTWVLTGGEDHALVATFLPGTALDPPWAVIGQVRSGTGVYVDGRIYPRPGGWGHFV